MQSNVDPFVSAACILYRAITETEGILTKKRTDWRGRGGKADEECLFFCFFLSELPIVRRLPVVNTHLEMESEGDTWTKYVMNVMEEWKIRSHWLCEFHASGRGSREIICPTSEREIFWWGLRAKLMSETINRKTCMVISNLYASDVEFECLYLSELRLVSDQ